MSGGGFFNRFVKYTEVKFEGEWNISGGLSLLLTPPGFVTYSTPIGTGSPGQGGSSSVTITRSDGKVLAISVDWTTTYLSCAVDEDVIIFTAEPGQPSDGPFK